MSYFNLQSLLYISCNILFSNCLSGHTISTYQMNMICGKPHASGCKWHSLLHTVRSTERCYLTMVPNPTYILMNVICGKPLSHHGTQTLLPLLCRQVNANDTRLYAWVSQLINDPFEATGSFFWTWYTLKTHWRPTKNKLKKMYISLYQWKSSSSKYICAMYIFSLTITSVQQFSSI